MQRQLQQAKAKEKEEERQDSWSQEDAGVRHKEEGIGENIDLVL